MEQSVRTDNRAEAVTISLRDEVGVPPDRLAGLRKSPFWSVVLEIASTLPRESRAGNTYRSWEERLAQ
jgi:hypothetical protein